MPFDKLNLPKNPLNSKKNGGRFEGAAITPISVLSELNFRKLSLSAAFLSHDLPANYLQQ